MKKILLLLSVFIFIFASDDENITDITKTQGFLQSLNFVNEELNKLQEHITTKNIWIERFQIKTEIKELKQNQRSVEKQIKKLWRKRDKKSKKRLKELLKQKSIIKSQLSLLGDLQKTDMSLYIKFKILKILLK